MLDDVTLPEFEEQSVVTLRADLEALIDGAKDCAEALSRQARSRSLSCVITKLEEAEMWLERLSPTATED